jgi:hypothetical protein
MAEVFLCQSGQLTAASRREMKHAGIVVVEVADPAACQFIRATEVVSADDMLWAAIDALKVVGDHNNKGTEQRERLAVNLWKIVTAARQERAGEPR